MNSPEELLRICRHAVDSDARPVALHNGHRETHALRARTRHGDVIVKVHRGPQRHGQEVHAYRHWAPALGSHAPRLLVQWQDPLAVIVTAVPGEPVADLELEPEAERDTYRRAGQLLRAWHNAAPPRTDSDMAAWLAHRGEQWLKLAEHILNARQRSSTRSHLRALANLGPIPAVPCHLDFTPRNLLRAPDGSVALIDFEHARHDLAARDLVRLHRRVWRNRADLRDAFLETYGPLSDLDREIIERCAHLDALTAAVRAANLALPEGDIHRVQPPPVRAGAEISDPMDCE